MTLLFSLEFYTFLYYYKLVFFLYKNLKQIINFSGFDGIQVFIEFLSNLALLQSSGLSNKDFFRTINWYRVVGEKIIAFEGFVSFWCH